MVVIYFYGKPFDSKGTHDSHDNIFIIFGMFFWDSDHRMLFIFIFQVLLNDAKAHERLTGHRVRQARQSGYQQVEGVMQKLRERCCATSHKMSK